ASTVYLRDLLSFPTRRSSDLDQWKPATYTKDYFNNRFGFEKRQLQDQMLNALTQVKQPGLAIIEAPMGSGKTETALALAEDYARSEEHTSELQSRFDLVCRLL